LDPPLYAWATSYRTGNPHWPPEPGNFFGRHSRIERDTDSHDAQRVRIVTFTLLIQK
jgi:hypothetical protein